MFTSIRFRFALLLVAILSIPCAITFFLSPRFQSTALSSAEGTIAAANPESAHYQPTAVAGIYVKRPVVDLGVLQPDSTASAIFRIRNFSRHSVSLDGIVPECGCTDAGGATGAIAPGHEIQITATLTASKLEHGPFEKRIRLQFVGADVGSRFPLTLIGSISEENTFAVFPAHLDCGNAAPGQDILRKLYFTSCSGVLSSIPDEMTIPFTSACRIDVPQTRIGGDIRTKPVLIRVRVPRQMPDSEARMTITWHCGGAINTTVASQVSIECSRRVSSFPKQAYAAWEMNAAPNPIQLHLISPPGRHCAIKGVTCGVPAEWTQEASADQSQTKLTLIILAKPVAPAIIRSTVVVDFSNSERLSIPLILCPLERKAAPERGRQ